MPATRWIASAVASFVLMSILGIERNDGSSRLVIAPAADALFCCRRIARAFRRATRAVTRTVSRAARTVARGVTSGARAVGRAATSAGRKVGSAVGSAARTVGRAAKSIADQAVNLVKKGAAGLKEIAAKGLEGLKTIGELVKKGLVALKDLLEWVWQTMRDKLLRPVGNYFRGLIDKAKAAMNALIEKARVTLGKVFQANVLVPALKWAFEAIFPGGRTMATKIQEFVQRLLGRPDALSARQEELAATMRALAEGDLAGYREAMAKFEAGLQQWTSITLKDVVEQLVAEGRERIVEFVRAKTVDLLEAAFGIVERPIELGKNAALSALSSIPFVGGLLRGAADLVITQGLKILRGMGFQFVAGKAAELAGKAIDQIAPFLLRGAGALDGALRPVVERLRPYLDEAMKLVGGVRDEWYRLRDKLKQGGAVFAKAQGS